MLAIPWYFAMQHQTERFGWVYIGANLLALIWVPYAGTIVDRYDRKKVFLGLTLIVGAVIAGIAFYGHSLGELPWYLVGFIFMLTFWNFSLHYPTLYAFTQEITEKKYYSRITSWLEIQGQLTTMMAGAIGALLLEGSIDGTINILGFKVNSPFDFEAWQIYEVFTLDAATYFVSFLLILSIRYIPLQQRFHETGRFMERLKTGVIYLREHPYIFLFGLASYCIFVTVLIEGFYLNAIYVKNHLEAGGDIFANAKAFYAIGALAAGISIVYIFKKWTIPGAIILMTALTALVYFSFFATKLVSVLLIGSAILGLTNAGTRVLRVTWLFRTVPNQVFGRANSVFNIVTIVFRLGLMLIFTLPFFHRSNHIIWTMVIMGIFLLIVVFILSRYYRKFVLQ